MVVDAIVNLKKLITPEINIRFRPNLDCKRLLHIGCEQNGQKLPFYPNFGLVPVYSEMKFPKIKDGCRRIR